MGAGRVPIVFPDHQDGSEGLSLPFKPAENTDAESSGEPSLIQTVPHSTGRHPSLVPLFLSQERFHESGETEAVRKQLAKVTQPEHLNENGNPVFSLRGHGTSWEARALQSGQGQGI